jgi:putative intracellular protease/amidase
MKKKVYILVFDGFADWEAAHALCGIAMSGKHEIVTAGFSKEPVRSMGNLNVTPDITLEEINTNDAALLVLPGGTRWEQSPNPEVIQLLQHLKTAKVPVAAICGATLEVARAGLTHGVRHSSNALEYLKIYLPDYQDEAFYVNEPAVSDELLITAGAVYSVEFAREIFRRLETFSEAQIENWFNLYKHGVWTPELAQVT